MKYTNYILCNEIHYLFTFYVIVLTKYVLHTTREILKSDFKMSTKVLPISCQERYFKTIIILMDKNSILAYYFRQECSMYFNFCIYIIAIS